MTQRYSEWALTVVAGALFVVAVLVMFVPELRTPSMRTANTVLGLSVGGVFVLQAYRRGFLGLTPREIFLAPNKPKVSLLTFAAMTASTIATMMF